MKPYFLLFFLFIVPFVRASEDSTVTIEGYAPAYVGSTVSLYQIDDYVSYHESRVATATVGQDSLFKMTFVPDETRKLIIRSAHNLAYLYVEPGASYQVYFPERDPYVAPRASGNVVELTFYNIDSTDINYKILQFQHFTDQFLAETYRFRTDMSVFGPKMDSLRETVAAYYGNDSSLYFKTYVRYTMASLDDIQFQGERNRYEKYTFYLQKFPVYYQNDRYMEYLNSFYDRMMPRLGMETNNRVYLGLLKSSPTLIMRALANEFTLSNVRVREIVMLKSLSEEYNAGEFPQTNILTVLDSVANNSLFEANAIIAKNLRTRLTEIAPGAAAPDFALRGKDGMLTRHSFEGKHVYMHFLDPSNIVSQNELKLLRSLYELYRNEVEFFTIVESASLEDSSARALYESIPWPKATVDAGNKIFDDYQAYAYPHYVLLDPFGYVVQSPALGPAPNGVYQTIETTFYQIQRVVRQNRSVEED